MGCQQTFSCRDSSAARDCDWEVRDSDESELLESARLHLQRRHSVEILVDRLRTFLRSPIQGIGGI